MPKSAHFSRKTENQRLARSVNQWVGSSRLKSRSPRLSQLDSCLVERGTLQVNRLRRSPIIALFPWNVVSETERDPKPVPMEPRDPLKLARYYQSLLGSGRFESRAALARYLGVSRPRVTQVLRRLGKE